MSPSICSGSPTNSVLLLDSKLRDPYEAKFVKVARSNIEGAMEGLFAVKDIEVHTTVAFYNGSIVEEGDEQDISETNNYKIFDPADMPDGTIDIPLWAQVRF